MADKIDVLLVGAKKPTIVDGLKPAFNLHIMADAKDGEAFLSELAPRIRAMAVSVSSERIDRDLMARLPRLEIVSTFAVGYDHVDAKWAGEHGIIVTNTPGVLTEEVADTALGLLLCTVREFPQAERFLRAGKWLEKGYRLTPATLRDRTVGLVGMGSIGQAIARRLDAFKVPVVYHTRRPRPEVPYRHYPDLLAMARDVGYSAGDRAGRTRDAEHDRRQSARRARPGRHLHQHGARLGGGRAGIDQGAAGKAHPVGRARRLCQRAGGAAGIDRDGQRRAVSASRFRHGGDAAGDGPARGGQSLGLGRRQAAFDAGARDTLAAEEAGVIICPHAP